VTEYLWFLETTQRSALGEPVPTLVPWLKKQKTQNLLALPTTKAKDIVFRFIIEYSSIKGFWTLGSNNRSIFIQGFLKDDILACVETWD